MRTEDIKNYNVAESLRDGRGVTIRAIRPGDKGLVIDALNKLSPESIYTRLFTQKKSFTEKDLMEITEVDFLNVVALVAVVEEDGVEQIAGGGRYIRIGESGKGNSAEVAFLTGDAFQGIGIASRILAHLITIARDSGVTQFEAEVLSSNQAMLKVFAGSGIPVVRTATPDCLHVLMDLTGKKDEKQLKASKP